MTHQSNSEPAQEADAGEETYKAIRRECDEKLARFSTQYIEDERTIESLRRAEMLLNTVIDNRDATIESLRRQLGLCNVDQANAEAENAALREPIPADDAMRIVLEWYDSDKSGVELIRRAEAWKYPRGKQRTSLLEDAERYRWFRSKRLWDADSFPWPNNFEYPEPCLWDDGEMLDAAIDAARKV